MSDSVAQHLSYSIFHSVVHYAPLPAKAKELSMANLKAVTYDEVEILN